MVIKEDDSMKKMIQRAFQSIEDRTAINSIQRIHGGSINEAYKVKTKNSVYFLKHHSDPPPHFFRLEMKGLQLIRETKTVSVPNVYHYSDDKKGAFLLLEWVSGQKTEKTESMLGEQLATMHYTTNKNHGFEENTYIGILPQPNTLFQSWLEYYRDKRLQSQLEIGKMRKTIHGKRKQKLEKLINDVDYWIPKSNIPASLLHGDLWGGNWISGDQGKPYVIDPSILYGDRHFELAFTELFGGFSKNFYESYHAVYPIDTYYEDVKPLYQLFYLLVHLNLFGEVYGSQVDFILNHYIGN